MKNLYDLILKERSAILQNEPVDVHKLDVLGKLGYLAFTNCNNPDTIPDTFTMSDVWITPKDLDKLLKHLGYPAKVRLTFKNPTHKQMTYSIVKKQKKAS